MRPILPAIPGRRSLAAAVAAAFLVTVPGASALHSALRPAPALKVCCGFAAEVYATGLKRPTALAFGPDGLLYATQETGEVVAVGRSGAILSFKPDGSNLRIVATGLRNPFPAA